VAGTVVCLVDNPTAAEAIANADEPELRVVTAADEAALRERLEETAAGCLVVDTEALTADPGQVLAEARAVAPEEPVVWVTPSPGSLDDGALGPETTIVERSAATEEWSFLVEKVRAALREGSTDRGAGKYRRLVESARDGLYILDANAEVTYLNESFAEMLGYDREELLGSHAARTMVDGELERGQRLVQELIEADSRESEVIDMEMETKAGKTITVSINFVVFTDESGTYEGLMGIVRDITERKERERELERYETIVQAVTEPIYVLDTDERFVRVNDGMVEELGYDREALLGSHVSVVAGDDGVRRQEVLIGKLESGDSDRASTELQLEAADGTRRQYDINMAAIRDDGELEATVVTAHDVTELREHQRQLSVLDRVLRHNVRNKMSIVLGHANDIASRAPPATAERATAIREAATELLELSDSAREFESVFADDARRTTTVDVVETVENVVRELRTEHPSAEIDSALPESALARGHETFELALNELFENAIVHSDREEPTVEVTVVAGEESVEIRVADDGPGLDDTDRRALLRGTETPLEHTQGLGLWLVQWAVEVADGTIDIEENDPRGTLITVRLPTAGDG
jgi:PAS domain S-box-containing protein